MIESGTIQSVVGILVKAGPVLIVLLAFVVALFIWYRTNSMHVIFRWLWRRIAGPAKGNDTAFNDFMNAQDNLMQFRWTVGKARTVAQMHSLIKWGQDHNEDAGDITACGPYFDRELPGLIAAGKRPTPIETILLAIGAGLVASLLIFATVFATVPGALVTVKETKKWLLLGEQSAKSVLNPGTERLGRDQCQQTADKRIASSGLSAREVTIICEFYADPEFSKYIATTIRVQRPIFGLFAGMLLCFFLAMWRSFSQAKAAIGMAKRLDRPRP